MSQEQQPREYPVVLEIRQGPDGQQRSHFVNGQLISRGDYVHLVHDLCYRVAREHTLIVTIREAAPESTEKAEEQKMARLERRRERLRKYNEQQGKWQ